MKHLCTKPGLKLFLGWESYDRERGERRDPESRFRCPGCCTHVAAAPDAVTDSCPYVAEHASMAKAYAVLCLPRGSRVRFLGNHLSPDAWPESETDPWWAEQLGWVGESSRLTEGGYLEVETQERTFCASIACWEPAGDAPFGTLAEPNHSRSRSYWASNGDWMLGVMVRDAARLRREIDATFAESVRIARVDIVCWVEEDNRWQAKYRAEEKAREAAQGPRTT